MFYFRSPKPALIILLLVAASAAPALAGASLDIRPSECPNLIDRGTFGRFPVALVSDYDFVVSRVGVDVGSLELRRADGVGGSARPIIFRRNTLIVDVAAPAVAGMCSTFGVDGLRDLRVYFGQRRVVRQLQLHTLPVNASIELCLSGQVRDGTPFDVCDHAIVTDVRLMAEEPPDDGLMHLN